MQFFWCYALVILISFSLDTHASLFQQLYAGFKSSDQLEEEKVTKKLELNSIDVEINKNDWVAEFGVGYTDSFLQSLFSFQSQQTVSTTYQFGLKKTSFKYGTFEALHSQTTYDLSNWTGQSTALSNFNSDTVYESKNTLKYTYEILNEFQKLEEDKLNARKNLQNITQNINVEQTHYDFFTTYLNAKIRILQDRLTKESKASAQERVNRIRRRVRDGLSRDVDYTSARLAVLSQDENLLKNEAPLRESIVSLEDILDMNLPAAQYSKVSWTFKKPTDFPFLFTKNSYPELRRIKALNKLAKINLLRLDESESDSLSLSLGYSINAVNSDRAQANADAFGEGDNDEKSVILKYSIPLGLDKSSILATQRELQKKKNDLTVKNTASEMRVLSKVLSENIDRYARAIKIIDEKVSLSRIVVRENKKLYMRGQVSFEESLRSEESLISMKLTRVNMYALYEQALAQKAFLEGKILTFLERYKD